MPVKFLDSITVEGSATINLDSGDAFIINEPDKDQQGRLIFSYASGDPTLTIASRGSTAKLHIRSDATNNGLYLDEDGSIYVNNNISDGIKLNSVCLASIGTNAQKMDLGSATRPWGDIYSTGSYVNELKLDTIEAVESQETVSALFEESGIVKKRDLGSNAFNSTSIPTDAVLTSSVNQSIGGVKTFTSDVVTRTGGADGGMKIGGWPSSVNGYGFIGTANMTGSEYCMITDGTHTWVGAGTGGTLKLRGPANDSSPQIVIDGTSVTVDDGSSVGEGSIRAKYKSSDNSTGITSTFTVRNGNNSASLTFVVKDGIITSVTSSDRRLKKNIKLIGKSPSGINIYEFQYKVKYSKNYGTGKFQGVMSDEVPWRAVSVDKGGYDMVDYSMIDVEFKML